MSHATIFDYCSNCDNDLREALCPDDRSRSTCTDCCGCHDEPSELELWAEGVRDQRDALVAAIAAERAAADSELANVKASLSASQDSCAYWVARAQRSEVIAGEREHDRAGVQAELDRLKRELGAAAEREQYLTSQLSTARYQVNVKDQQLRAIEQALDPYNFN